MIIKDFFTELKETLGQVDDAVENVKSLLNDRPDKTTYEETVVWSELLDQQQELELQITDKKTEIEELENNEDAEEGDLDVTNEELSGLEEQLEAHESTMDDFKLEYNTAIEDFRSQLDEFEQSMITAWEEQFEMWSDCDSLAGDIE
jgi:chromosome segregation ATPase